MLSSLDKARLAVKASLDKKAIDPLILEIRNLTIVADYFVICSGESTTQVRAIADHVEETLGNKGVRAQAVEGRTVNTWVLIDYGDVIVHVFEADAREFYELEKLWLDAAQIAAE